MKEHPQIQFETDAEGKEVPGIVKGVDRNGRAFEIRDFEHIANSAHEMGCVASMIAGGYCLEFTPTQVIALGFFLLKCGGAADGWPSPEDIQKLLQREYPILPLGHAQFMADKMTVVANAQLGQKLVETSIERDERVGFPHVRAILGRDAILLLAYVGPDLVNRDERAVKLTGHMVVQVDRTLAKLHRDLGDGPRVDVGHARNRALRIPFDQGSKNSKTLRVGQHVRHDPLAGVRRRTNRLFGAPSDGRIIGRNEALSTVLHGTRTITVIGSRFGAAKLSPSSTEFSRRTILVRSECSASKVGLL